MRIHRRPTLAPADMTTHRGVPVTTPERTIVDLARMLDRRALERVIDLAGERGLVDFGALRRYA